MKRNDKIESSTKIIKENLTSESLFIVHTNLEALYQKYEYELPINISSKIEELIKETEQLIYGDKLITDTYDIKSQEIIIRVQYEKFESDKKNH